MRIFYFAEGTNKENTLLKIIDNFNVVAITVANIEKAKEMYKKQDTSKKIFIKIEIENNL